MASDMCPNALQRHWSLVSTASEIPPGGSTPIGAAVPLPLEDQATEQDLKVHQIVIDAKAYRNAARRITSSPSASSVTKTSHVRRAQRPDAQRGSCVCEPLQNQVRLFQPAQFGWENNRAGEFGSGEPFERGALRTVGFPRPV